MFLISNSIVYAAISIAICNCILPHQPHYVSRNGSDHWECGAQTDPCGTLFMASKLIHDWSAYSMRFGIYLVDGQNETLIDHYHTFPSTTTLNTTTYDPCLPIPFPTWRIITITFNADIIANLLDWYPLDICQNHSLSYRNEYMFEGGMRLFINNLIINDYQITDANDTYSIIRSIDYYDAAIVCDNCTFRNVTSSTIYELPLIHSRSSIRLYNNRFSEIQADGTIIFADDLVYHLVMTYYQPIRNITLHQTLFQDINSKSILTLKSADSTRRQPNTAQLDIASCAFFNIDTMTSIVTDNAHSCNSMIKDTKIDVASGLIYHSQHVVSSTIQISNIHHFKSIKYIY
eukprot:591758_1